MDSNRKNINQLITLLRQYPIIKLGYSINETDFGRTYRFKIILPNKVLLGLAGRWGGVPGQVHYNYIQLIGNINRQTVTDDEYKKILEMVE